MAEARAAISLNPLFDRDWYLVRYPDIAAARVDPWRHYLIHGASEGRSPNPLFDSDWYCRQYPEVRTAGANALLHYWDHGTALGCEPNPWFDTGWYLQRYPEVREEGINSLLHYWRSGAALGYDPCPQFSSKWYLRINTDIQPGRMTPLGDYLQYGRREGRSITQPAPRVVRAEQKSGPRERIAVYTVIAGGYDFLKLPEVVDPDCDYYCFTDLDISWQDIWMPRPISWRHADPARTSRHIKHLPHLYFPGHQWSVWIDANLQLNCSPRALMPSWEDWDFAAWRHPERDCLYTEAEACVHARKDDPATIHAQVDRYRKSGFPEHAGLAECNVLIRRHHAPAMIGLAEAWWSEIEHGSRRDQLSFPFVTARRTLRTAWLGPVGNNTRNDPRFRFFPHTLRRLKI